MTSMTGTAQTAEPAAVDMTGEAVKPFAPAAAAVLAGAVGCFVLGLMTTLAEASTGMHDWLEFNTRVGPLSGKTIIAAIAFFVIWGVLALVLRGKNPAMKTVIWISGVLVALGLLMTFPTFFQSFA